MSERRNRSRRERDPSEGGPIRSWFRAGRGTVLVLGLLLLFLILTYAVVLSALRPRTPGRELTLDQLTQRVNDRRITAVTYLAEDNRFVGTDERGAWWVGTTDSDVLTSQLLGAFTSAGVRTRIDTQTGKALLALSTSFALPGATFVVGFAFLYSLFRGGPGNELGLLARSRARRHALSRSEPQVTFADVAGLDEAIEEIREVKEFLTAPQAFEAMGAKPPRGVLMSGPPGTGKTLLAKAVAGEAGVPFFSISASEFTEMLVGVGPARVRDLFKDARAAAPSIIFVDEIDAIGRARAAGDTLNPEAESTLNELLVQLDGFDAAKGVVLMAATNRPEILDQALIRKGRFDRHIVVDVPDFAGRVAIFRVHARGKPLGPDVDLERFARRTVGFSGADISATMNEAATLAARRRQNEITSRDIGEAIERVLAGPERRSRILGPSEKQRVAYHEAGHAVAGWVLSSVATVDKVSIVARGHSLGSTWSLPLDDRRVRTRSQIEEEITAALAGRAAENLVFGDPSGGAQMDLVRATQLAREMVLELGMSDALGPLALGMRDGAYLREYSEELAREADREVRRVLEQADERARKVLTTHRAYLDRLAGLLVARESLEHQDLEEVLAGLPKRVVSPVRSVTPPANPQPSRRAAARQSPS